MASIGVSKGPHGKKSLDAEIPLVPFIDLLLCCVMFLLVTAVWNQLSAITANQTAPVPNPTSALAEPETHVVLEIRQSEFVLASTAGDRIVIPNVDGLAELATALETRHRLAPNEAKLVLAPDDDVAHGQVIEAMDLALAAGYEQLTFGG